MIIFLLFGLILTQNCQNGIKRGNKFCACYSGYSGSFCEKLPNVNITTIEKAPVRVDYEKVTDDKSKVKNYLLTIRQKISPTRKQATIVCGKNFNCNYPQSPYWTQSLDDDDDVFQMDMTIFKKYKCKMNEVKYYESPKIDEIIITDPVVATQETKVSPYNSYSQTNNLQYMIVNMTLITYVTYPGYLSNPSLPTINMKSNCKPGDTVCTQTWDLATVCGMINPYPLIMTMNCRTSDPSCISQSLVNMMILYDDACLLQSIPFNLFTYQDMTLKKPKQSYDTGDVIYVNVQLEQCNYQVTEVKVNDKMLISSSIATNYGNSLSYISYPFGFGFIMPSNDEQILTLNAYLTCPDGTSTERTTSITIKSNKEKQVTTFTMFFVTMMIVYALFFLIMIVHIIKRQVYGVFHYILFGFVFAFIICKVVCHAFFIAYLNTSETTLNIFYHGIYSISSCLFLTILSSNIEIIERKVISKKTILSIFSLVSIIFITIHICVTVFDIVVIIFFDHDVYYKTISSIISTIMVIIHLIILGFLLFKATIKNRSLGADLPKLIFAKFILLISASAKITYLSLCIYTTFAIVNLQWIDLFNFIHEISFLCLLPILF